MEVNVRIPGWARNQPVASDLYRYAATPGATPTLKVNGKAVPLKVEKGYVSLTRTWKAGDVIELSLPMEVRRVVANEQVAADVGRVALERGPIVYAFEWPDNPDGKVRNLLLADNEPLRTEWRPENGINVVNTKAVALSYDMSRRGRNK